LVTRARVRPRHGFFDLAQQRRDGLVSPRQFRQRVCSLPFRKRDALDEIGCEVTGEGLVGHHREFDFTNHLFDQPRVLPHQPRQPDKLVDFVVARDNKLGNPKAHPVQGGEPGPQHFRERGDLHRKQLRLGVRKTVETKAVPA
jgi:hypothetical protein